MGVCSSGHSWRRGECPAAYPIYGKDGCCEESCEDTEGFVDEGGYWCSRWAGVNCKDNEAKYTPKGLGALLANCKKSCALCQESCEDTEGFVDEGGYWCSQWAGVKCKDNESKYTP